MIGSKIDSKTPKVFVPTVKLGKQTEKAKATRRPKAIIYSDYIKPEMLNVEMALQMKECVKRNESPNQQVTQSGRIETQEEEDYTNYMSTIEKDQSNQEVILPNDSLAQLEFQTFNPADQHSKQSI